MTIETSSFRILISLCFIIAFSTIHSQDTIHFESLAQVWQGIKKHNITFEKANIQEDLAELAHKTSIGNAFNPRVPVNLDFIDYTRLQNFFLPAEVLGGHPGDFRQVTFGQQYNTQFVIQPQLDLFNLSSISKIKYAKTNKELVKNKNTIDEMSLYNDINAIYHNILSLKEQIDILDEGLILANQILKTTEERFNEGLIRKQEVNEAKINSINILNQLEQLSKEFELQNQLLSLYFENDIIPILIESLNNPLDTIPPTILENKLAFKNLALETQLIKQEVKSIKYENIPTLSFISSLNWQNLSNDFFLASGSTGINYNSIGLRLGWQFPTVQRLSNLKNKQYELRLMELNSKHLEKENALGTAQLLTEFEKKMSQYRNMEAIYKLKEDSFEKNFNQYNEQILPLDKLLISQNEVFNSAINVIVAKSQLAYTKNKILINNHFQP